MVPPTPPSNGYSSNPGMRQQKGGAGGGAQSAFGGQSSGFQPTFGGQSPWQQQPVSYFGMPGATQNNPTARPAQRGTGRYNDMAYGGAFGNNHYGNFFDNTAQQPGSYAQQQPEQQPEQQPQWTNPYSPYGGSFGVGLEQPNIPAVQAARRSAGVNPLSVFPGAWGGSPGMSEWQQTQRMNNNRSSGAGAAAQGQYRIDPGQGMIQRGGNPQYSARHQRMMNYSNANRLPSPSQGMQGGRPQFDARDHFGRQTGWF